MTSVRSLAPWLLPVVLALVSGAAPAGAATLLDYADEASFQASATGPSTSEAWDAYPAGRRITGQIQGVTFSSPNSNVRNFVPIQVMATGGAKSAPNALGGGFAKSSGRPPEILVLDFAPAIVAFSFYLIDQDPTATNVVIRFDLADQTVVTRSVINPHPSHDSPIFYGATSDTPIVRITLTAGFKNGGQGGFEEFTVDNLFFARGCPQDTIPPVCAGHPVAQGNNVVIEASATDDQGCDSGIASVAVRSGGTNVSVSLDPAFQAGDPVARFTAAQTDFSLDGQATVIATDGAGNTCSLPVCFHALPGGPVVNQVVCCGDGFLLQVTNGNNLPAGTAACSASLPGPSEPPFPPGYEPSPPEDPFPCQVLTIESPISGLTDMVYKKDAAFEPRLRMLFSRSADGGETYPPFIDVTTSVEPILTVVPDPTRVSGSVKWSPVKVACALLGEADCSGVDPSFDFDQDGYPLCPAAGSGILADCNDQISPIHPGAAEVCNGMDDDCDGVFDDGNPGGGAECPVPGAQGACALGTTACFEGHLICNQSVQPAGETCDGVDNDCDGAVDEGLETLTCGIGACSRTVNNCVGGVPQTCTPGTPTTETCNGIDDDCDGATDEGLGLTSCGTGACSRSVNNCVGGVTQTCSPGSPTAETCNGIDDDCDGATDESLGSTTCGTGGCSRTVNNCVGGVSQTCSPGTPTTETCNGIDDDCDGTVDEGLGTLTCGAGTCVRTINACLGGTPQVCVPAAPSPEICNGIDDDCDGRIDEEYSFSGFGQPVEDDGSGVYHRRQTIPFKFSIRTCAGALVSGARATIEVLFYQNGVVGNKVKDITSTGQANTDNIYRFDSQGHQYIYNLGTTSLSTNTSYIVRTRIDDGSIHDVIISIIK